MKRTQYLILFGLLAMAFLTVSPVSAYPVYSAFQNGLFMSDTDPGSFITLNGGDSATIPYWTVTGNSIDYIGSYWQAPPVGGRSIDLDGNALGGIQQTFSTTQGAQYKVSFYLAGNPDGGYTTKDVLVATVGSPIQYQFTNTSATTRADMGWALESFTFTANPVLPFTTLSFDSQTAGGYGPVIGEVSVSQIPVPSTVMLLGSGLVGLGLLRRKWSLKK